MRIKCNEIYTEQGCVDGILELEGTQIKDVILSNQEDSFDQDLSGYRILPGLIDIHTHGYQGCNAQSVSKEELLQLTRLMASAGVTSFLPTAGEHFEDELENLSKLADIIEEKPTGSRMLGIHMEGPFLNPEKKGAFTLQQLHMCDIRKAKEYIDASKNHISYMSLAPELDPDGVLIKYLISKNIIVAGGHTNATYEEYCQGIEAGIKASTHTGNGMRRIDRREAGAMGAALLSDRVYCEVICDFHHISMEMLEIMFRIKPGGMKNMIMISDSGHLSGNPPGVYEKYGQTRIIDESGIIHLEDGTIAGSSHNMLYGIKNLEQHMHKKMEDIILMSSWNPARLLGIENQKGSIAKGKDGDFVVIDKDYNVVYTFVEGTCVYSKS